MAPLSRSTLINQRVRSFQQNATALMPDTCTVSRPAPAAKDAYGGRVAGTPSTIYQGACRITPNPRFPRADETIGQIREAVYVAVFVPVTVDVQATDEISAVQADTGQTYQLVAAGPSVTGSYGASRRVTCFRQE